MDKSYLKGCSMLLFEIVYPNFEGVTVTQSVTTRIRRGYFGNLGTSNGVKSSIAVMLVR